MQRRSGYDGNPMLRRQVVAKLGQKLTGRFGIRPERAI